MYKNDKQIKVYVGKNNICYGETFLESLRLILKVLSL